MQSVMPSLGHRITARRWLGLLSAVICLGLAASCNPAAAQGSHPVKGHVTKNGTYVAPHRATNPNHTKRDNYSTRGNVNPYTGKPGTKNP